MLFFQQKMAPLFLISRCSSLSLFFLLSFTGLSPTLSFSDVSFSFSIFQICGRDWHIICNLRLIHQAIPIRKQFPLSFFVLIDFLVVSASQEAGGYAISRQNSLELHLGCQQQTATTTHFIKKNIELFYIGVVVISTNHVWKRMQMSFET